MSSELQERIAKAMAGTRRELIARPLENIWPELALAAMKAARDPTETMVDHAKWKTEDDGLLEMDRDDFEMQYRAAINAEIAAAEGGEND